MNESESNRMLSPNEPANSASLAHLSLLSLSPLDGRYHSKIAPLAPLMSEVGYMHRRVQVEITWLIALGDALQAQGFTELPALSDDAKAFATAIIRQFSVADAAAIKTIEKVTNHDVKAVEYWLVERFAQHSELKAASAFVHFACTSEDINNTSHALQLQAARDTVLVPKITALMERLQNMAHAFADTPMLSRTHGQTATPTTVGKEFANVVRRLQTRLDDVQAVQLRAKMNGAVGNYNAHLAAYPSVDWAALAKRVVEAPVPQGLGLRFQDYSTQIEPHDDIAALFHALMRVNTVLIDLSRDVWGYVSLGYFKQKLKAGEIGSSTMPHKVNPIDFENAEGNLGLANAMLEHMAGKLPISRWQRDLSDSTVLRNMGVGFGYSLLAYESLLTGLGKLELNDEAILADLDCAWEVLAEPIQTVMRRFGVQGAYEQLKEATRGKVVRQADLHTLIHTLTIPDEDKARLLALTPRTYLGLAASLARSA